MFPIVWGQTKSSINRVFIIEKKAFRTTHFKDKFDHTSSLFSESNKIKFPEKISIENCLFVSKSLTNQLREIANNWFVSLCVSLLLLLLLFLTIIIIIIIIIIITSCIILVILIIMKQPSKKLPIDSEN